MVLIRLSGCTIRSAPSHALEVCMLFYSFLVGGGRGGGEIFLLISSHLFGVGYGNNISRHVQIMFSS